MFFVLWTFWLWTLWTPERQLFIEFNFWFKFETYSDVSQNSRAERSKKSDKSFSERSQAFNLMSFSGICLNHCLTYETQSPSPHTQHNYPLLVTNCQSTCQRQTMQLSLCKGKQHRPAATTTMPTQNVDSINSRTPVNWPGWGQILGPPRLTANGHKCELQEGGSKALTSALMLGTRFMA